MVNLKIISTITAVIIAVVIIFTFVGGSGKTITDAGNTITNANNCSESVDGAGIPHVWNETSRLCDNSTGGNVTAALYNLPLNTLFGGSGVLILILMSMILLLVIGWVWKMNKK